MAPEDYADAPPDEPWAARGLANPDHIALLAEQDGTPVGALTAYVLPKFEQARSEIYIYDLAVLEAARRQGVASALIDHLRAIARDIGAWTIFVQADIDPEDAQVAGALPQARRGGDHRAAPRHRALEPAIIPRQEHRIIGGMVCHRRAEAEARAGIGEQQPADGLRQHHQHPQRVRQRLVIAEVH